MNIAKVKYDKVAKVYVATDPIYGIMSQGETRDSALVALQDAVDGYLRVCEEHALDPDKVSPNALRG
jgi:predicted RNase H-like HicB family nuclease